MAERVMVFIDGQNLVMALQQQFDTRAHPLLLARWLAGDRELVETRYYSGIHDRDENQRIHDLARRRHDLIARTGVVVVERTLRYHWEWRIDDDLRPPQHADDGERHRVEVKRYRAAREKGIDLALGLDAVTAAFTDTCDTLVVVSRDRDLVEVAKEINERARLADTRVEVALVAGRDRHGMDGYDHTHWIDQAVVDQVRDDFDYRSDLPAPEVDAFLADL